MTTTSSASALARSLQHKLGTADLANPVVLAAVEGVLDELHRTWREEGERAGYQRFEDQRKRRNDLLLKLVGHPAYPTAANLIAALVFADRTEIEIRVVLAEVGAKPIDHGAVVGAVALFDYGLTASEVAADLVHLANGRSP